MAVYVDEIMACIPNKNWKWTKACHLVADTLDELHLFAAKLGLKRAWFQNNPRLPHYDLTEGRRKKAVELGAVEIDRKGLAARMKRLQNAAYNLKENDMSKKHWWKFALAVDQREGLLNIYENFRVQAAANMSRSVLKHLEDLELIGYTETGNLYITELGKEWVENNRSLI
jgi:hypothetical protein